MAGPLPLQTRPVPIARKFEQNKMQGPQRQGYNQVMEITPGPKSRPGLKAGSKNRLGRLELLITLYI